MTLATAPDAASIALAAPRSGPLADPPADADFPATRAQRRLWAAVRGGAIAGAYTICFALRLQGPLDRPALEKALAALQARHESLRTCFAEAAHGLCQCVRASVPLPLTWADHAQVTDPPSACRAALDVWAALPFDLAAAPLWRARLARLSTDDHVLSVAIHHIVADAWSIDVLQRDLALLYTAFAAGQVDALPPLGSLALEIVRAEEEQGRGAAFAAARAHWLAKLVPPPPRLQLPVLHSSAARGARPARSAGLSHVTLIDELLVDGLREQAEAHRTTLFVALAALVRLLLHRYTGAADIVLGTPIAGRDDPALEAQAGLFVNMLPLRDAIDPTQGFDQLLLQADRTALEAYRHRHYPFDQIVEDLGGGVGALFDVIVALQPDAVRAPVLRDLAVSTFDLRPTFARYDLAFEFAEHAGGLTLLLTYDTALLDAPAAARLAGHFERLLESVLAAPQQPVGALGMLTGAERRALAGWNATARPLPEQGLAALFAAQVRAAPEAAALRDDNGTLSYAALAASAGRLARLVARRLGTADAGGEAPGEAPVVGLCLGRGRGMITAMLAVLQAGAAYLPLDPAEPAERLAFMLAEADAALVLVDGDSGAALPPDCPRLDIADAEMETDVAAPLPVVPGGERLAYVMFTSGSTGRPKAVEIPHRAVIRLVCNTDYVRFGPGQVIAQASTPLFDAATFEVWGALLNGAALRLLGRDDVLDPDRLSALLRPGLLRGGAVTTLFLTTPLFNRLAQLDPTMFADLDLLVVGGDVIDPVAARAVRTTAPPRRLVNGYGPTEATTFAICHEIGEVAAEAASVPIGRPIANTVIHLLDAAGGEVPVGVTGEIHIGGPGLARGYRNRPELTEERFFVHPTLGRLYRTGDLARRRADDIADGGIADGGVIEFLGRRDQQIKLRGFRIEPGEIEAQLRRQPGIAEALVRRHEVNGQPSLVAWIATRAAETDLDLSDVRAGLRRALPDHMVPAHLIPLAAFPLTANGKIDTALLPEPGATEPRAEPGRAVALSPTEELLAGLWSEVLPAQSFGRDTNFFDAGGHSLMAMQVVARVRERLGVALELRTLFEHARLVDLAQQVEGSLRGAALPELRPLPASVAPPLSFAQQRLWFLARLQAAAGAAYTIGAALELRGALDEAALRRALRALTARQQSLRMNVAAPDSEPVLRLRKPYDPLELAEETPADEAALLASVSAALGAPFDLEHDALLRLKLWRLGPERWVLGFAIHHIIADGWSLDVLVREVSALYAAEISGTPASLAPLAVQYGDYAAWQRDWLSGAERARQLAHWRDALAGMPALLELPGDHPRPAARSYRGGQHQQVLDAALVGRLTALGRRHGATLFMTLLAAFDVLLARWSGSGDIAVGSPVANRAHSRSEALVGLFVNTLVLRVQLDLDQPFEALLGTVRRTALAAYAHQDLPFEVLVSELQPQRSLGHSPLFQVMFALQNAPLGAVSLPELAVRPLALATVTAKFDLVVSLSETAAGDLAAVWEYSTDLFEAATVARLAGHYATLLESVLAAPTVPVGVLEMLTGAERRALTEWNATARPLPEQGLAALFAAQVAAAPDAPALRDESGTLSYAALAASAGRLARRVARRLGTADAGGEAPGEAPVVGLCLGRGRGMITAMLAVLQAGAAYLPLDPAEPAERLAFMLAEADAALVLVDGDSGAALPAACPRLDIADTDAETDAEAPLPVVPGGDRLAYVMFTSGSTGRPKAVEIPHRAVVRLVCNTDYVRFGPGQVIAQASTPLFDAATFEVWGALLNGAALRLLGRDDVLDPDRLSGLLRGRAVTTLFLTTSLFNRLAQLDPTIFADLDDLLFGGEAADPASVRAVLTTAPPRRLLNAYGPTEATAFAICHEVGHVAPDAASVPIGRPIANTVIHLLDAAGGEVPVGVTGEIHIGGPGLARGYRNRPELTEERFFVHPTLGRLYRTGDLARRRADGVIEFLGRRDQQIKLRGFRIEPGEIEAQLRRQPGIAEAPVRRHEVNGQPSLVAWIVTRVPDLDLSDVRARLRRALPDHMVPAHLIPLAAFLLTANGKIDTALLPGPRPNPIPEGEENLTAQEAALAAIWGTVLRRDDVGRHDNFFELGGDSIASIQVVALVRAAGLRLAVADLFRHQTVAELAPLMVASSVELPEPANPGVPFPLSPIQSWFFAQPLGDHSHFNQAVLLTPRRPLAPASLRRALAVLMEQHAALRLRFATAGTATPSQNYAPSGDDLPFHAEDLRGLPIDRQNHALQNRATEWQRSLDLAQGPLLRMVLFEVSTGQRLLWCIHHLAVDAVSWRILLADLEHLLVAAHEERPLLLPPATAPFSAWVRHLEQRAAVQPSSTATPSALPAWDLPIDRAGVATRDSTRHVERRLDPRITHALIDGGSHRAYNTGIDDFLLTALAIALADWTGRRDWVIDLEGHGRPDGAAGPDLSRTVGWFTAIRPVHLILPEGQAPGMQLMAIKERLRAVPDAGIGAGAPIAFNYLGQIDQTLGGGLFDFAAEGAGESHTDQGLRSRLLEVDAAVSAGVFRVVMSYSANQFDEATIVRLADGFAQALETVVVHCRSPDAVGYTPSDFPLIALPRPALDELARRHGRAVKAIYPLTPMQQGLLFHSLDDRTAYVELLHCRIDGAFDAAGFRAAWDALIRRHAVLRTAFEPETDPPSQLVFRSAALPWGEHDWRHLDPARQDAALRELVAAERQRGFDLGAAPLMRCHIVRLGDASVRFVWCFHHVLLDGWSLPILIGELMRLYRDPAASLPPGPPFEVYIAWLARQDQEAALAHWRAMLASFDTPTPLSGARAPVPHDRPQSHAEILLELDDADSAGVLAFAHAHRLTFATVLQGAWALLLHRWSGDPDVVFGVTVSGRDIDLPDIQAMLGLLINTVPSRVRIDPGALVPWLLSLQEAHQANMPFAFVPLADVQRCASIPAGAPLFETLLVVENYPTEVGFDQGRDAGLAVSDVRFHDHTSYKLTVIAAASDRIRLRIGYDERHFELATVERLARQIQTLLHGISRADAATPAATLPLLDDAERRTLAAWGEARDQYPATATLVELFAAAVRTHPDRRAVSCGDQHLTYRQLASRAQALADRLSALGIGRGGLVGLLADRSLDLVVGVLGILTSGAAYLPLDPGAPKSRLAFMVADAKAAALVAHPALAASLNLPGLPVLPLGEPAADASRETRDYAPAKLRPDDLAYVIYTSGSTGEPKGVMVTHANVARLFAATARECAFSEADVWTLFHSAAFDFSVWEIWGALLHGGRLVVASEHDRRDPAAFLDLVAREGVTVLSQTPSAFRQLMAAALHDDRRLALRLIVFGGEALELPALAPWFARHGDTMPRLVNMYGITETTVHVTWCPLTAADIDTTASWIGRPLGDLELFLLDGSGRPVPIGAPGEIHVGGAGVARGYLNRPELDAERFVVREILGRRRRVYRSGDLARWRPDGTLDYLGRIDEQVKIRGFRIEPGEIQACLLQHEQIREAAVMVRGDGEARHLVAYVVPGAAPPSEDELRRWLSARLPDYMVPAAYLVLDAMPLTGNGKIDRRALSKGDRAPLPRESRHVAPGNDRERRIAAIWEEILERAPIGVADSFFDLGGHSLTALRMLARLHHELGARVPLRSFLASPTVATLAALLAGHAEPALSPIEPAPAQPDYPLSHAQQRIWLDHYATSAVLYNMPEAFRFAEALDAGALRTALAQLIERHEILRTAFILREGTPRQRVLPSVDAPLRIVDLELAQDGTALTRALLDTEAANPFDLSEPPLLRALLIRQPGHGSVVVLVMHHIVADGWSRGLLHRELRTIYAAVRQGNTNPDPRPLLQYKDFATWEAAQDFSGDGRFWSERLNGAPTRIVLPHDRPGRQRRDFEGGRRTRVIEPVLRDALTRLATQRRSSLANLVLALFNLLLFRLSGQSDLVIGMVTANRPRPELESLIGVFVNVLPVRARLSDDMEFEELLDEVSAAAYAALDHQTYPFDLLVQQLDRKGAANARPFLDVMYTFQPDDPAGRAEIGQAAESLEMTFGFAKTELALVAIDDREGGLTLTLEYEGALFEGTSIDSHLETLAAFAASIAASIEGVPA